MIGQIIHILFLLSISVWVGAIVFFSFIVAPTVFRELPREMAGDFIGKLFPQYYTMGYALGFLSLASLLMKSILQKNLPWLCLLLLILMLASTFYAGISIHPKAHMLKTVIRTLEEGPDKDLKQLEFNRLHRISVILNLVVLVLGIVVMGLTVVRLQ